jgi:hypothetical protein
VATCLVFPYMDSYTTSALIAWFPSLLSPQPSALSRNGGYWSVSSPM